MKSLSALLTDAPYDTLHALSHRWGAPTPENSSPEARQRLERAMRDTVAARFVWERLDDDERRVLFAVVGPSARNWCLLETLPSRAHLDTERCDDAVRRLVDTRLLSTEIARVQAGELVSQRPTFYGYSIPRNPQAQIEDKLIAYVPTELATGLYTSGRELFVAQADRSRQTLDELLMPYRQGDLDQIGRRFGLSIGAYYSRNEVRVAMAENLSQADAVRYALARVDPQLRHIYEWLRAHGGRAPLAAVRSFIDLDGAELAALIRTLEEYALAFDTFSQGERVLFIPQQTLENLRRAEERPRAQAGLQQCEAPAAVLPADTPFLWDLAVIVSAAYHQEIELTRSGTLPKRAAQRLLPFLQGARERKTEDLALAYVEQVKQEAVELGLVVAPPSTASQRGRLAAGPKLDSWARHDQVMQVRRIFRRWPANRWWVDSLGANYEEYLSYYLEQPLAREQVRRALRRCEPGTWYSVASFRASLQSDDPFVLRPSQRNAGEAGFRLADDVRAHWDRTDGEVVTGILRSTLRELGLVELGYDREAVPTHGEDINPDAFRITPLGAEVMTSDLSADVQPAPRPLVVQPNFQVLLMEPHMGALYWLVRFASLEQAGRVSRFTLTREALLRGLASGGAIEDVVAFMESHSQKAIPQNVAYTLHDWSRQQPSATESETLLEVGDDALASEIVTSPRLRAFGLRKVGPRKVAVPAEASRSDLRRALERLGYASRLISGFEELVSAAAALPRQRSRRRQGQVRANSTVHIKGAL
jgi:Helicase conserved C-terminal domain